MSKPNYVLQRSGAGRSGGAKCKTGIIPGSSQAGGEWGVPGKKSSGLSSGQEIFFNSGKRGTKKGSGIKFSLSFQKEGAVPTS